jgi:multiple antibiotic resistance protein
MTSGWLSAFVTLLVTLGPIETAAIFAGLAKTAAPAAHRRLALRGSAIAGAMLLLFALAGGLVLELLHVSLPAFRVAGGVLLFLQALTLTFSSPGLSSISAHEADDAHRSDDIAVFPLAFPLIAGPGPLSAIVLLMGRERTLIDRAAIVGALGLSLLITLACLLAAGRITAALGRTGTDVVGRISGILLAALAVQFVFDGLRAGLIAGG